MTYRTLNEGETEKLDHKLDDVRNALLALHTLSTRLDAADEETGALFECVTRFTRDCTIALDECAGMIGGIQSGRFDPEIAAPE